MTQRTQEQIERDVRHKFWIEKYQQTGDITYRNKLWEETEPWCHVYMKRFIDYKYWGCDNYQEYERYMKQAFESALAKFDVHKGPMWITYVSGGIRQYMLNCRRDIAIMVEARMRELGYLEEQQPEWHVLPYLDPRDYAEEIIWGCDTRDFLSCLDEKDQHIIRLILLGTSMTEIADIVLHTRRTNDVRKRCERIGNLYKEYMSG